MTLRKALFTISDYIFEKIFLNETDQRCVRRHSIFSEAQYLIIFGALC
jgi:hypothetical protein